MRLFIDTTPLRVSRDFRRLWAGQAVSFIGSQVTSAALPYQVFHQTGSSLDVGLLGLAQLGPLLVFSILGGALADSFDKRRLVLGVTAVAMMSSAGLAINASLHHPQLWLIFVLGATSTAALGVSLSALRSMTPLLFDTDLRPSAYALQATYASFGMMAGPAMGGLLIAAFGLRSAYAADVATFALALLAFAGLSASPPVTAQRVSVLRGLRFLRGSLIVRVFELDLLAMVFGMPRAVFPALTVRLGGGPVLYGLLVSSVAAGAFLAALGSGWTRRVRRQGRALLLAVGTWGVAIAAAGLTHVPALVMALLACAGAADMISGIYRYAIAADATPDDLRGRVAGVELAVYAGGPVLGDVEAGVVGGLVGVPFAIVSGGLVCVLGAGLFALLVPDIARYRQPLGAAP